MRTPALALLAGVTMIVLGACGGGIGSIESDNTGTVVHLEER